MAMDTDIKAKWLEALRSGKYTQCSSSLKKDGGFCCLGVLADIQPGVTWVGGDGYERRMVPLQNGTLLSEGSIDVENRSGRLHRDFLTLVGITVTEAGYLMALNDTGDSFEKIANYVEERL
jgi:hypothetical protein